MKSHIGPEGPSRCRADVGVCPFGKPEDHFNTIVEAKTVYEARLKQAYDTVETVKVSKRRHSEKEKELLNKNAEFAKKIVELRAENSNGITFEDANPERAKRRLDESIEFAKSRHNEHLVQKLSKSTVLPSGAFKMADGSRVNTDAVLKNALVLKAVDEEREAVLKELTKIAREGDNTESKFQVKTDRGTYSLTITEGVDEEAFEKLPKKLRDACMSPNEGLNIDLAREQLPPAKFREIVSESQSLDYIYGKAADVGRDKIKVSKEFSGKTTDEKMKSGIKNIADFYDGVTKENGKIRDMKAYDTSAKEAIKTATAEKKTNTFVPARSQYNGAVVSRRENVVASKAKEILTEDELKKITKVTDKIDPKKAALILSDKEFGRIFKAKKAALRVTETKD